MVPRLLLADDSVTIQRVIELTFADEDVQVLIVGNGREAIERIETDHPDIVLADVAMPERDGYDVAAFIKDDPRFSHIPVLLLTGAFEPIDEARARAIGCDGVLVKPFEPRILIQRVRELLAVRSPTPASSREPAARQISTGARSIGRPGPKERVDAPDYFDRLDAAFAARRHSSHAASTKAPVPKGVAKATQSSLSDETIDEITRRVIARMGDETMRRAVLDTAEKLVREEIERIKRITNH